MTPFKSANLRPAIEGKNVLLGISGSIAAFKMCDVIRRLRDCGANVRVVLTDSAQKFVTPLTLETLSGQPVSASLWDDGHGTHHIDVARWADVALIAPATANTIARLALGLADDLLSTELLAFQGPVLVVPAMNPAMFSHAAVTQNIKILRARGVRILGPATGVTACGEEGLGRMIEPDAIVEEVARTFHAPSSGRKILITLGPTRSALDPVRYLTNRSSGQMGAALAWACVRAGDQVTAIAGPIAESVELPLSAEVVRVTTADEMFAACATRFESADVFISAAAVLDWDIANASPTKLKKETTAAPTLAFRRNVDILTELSRKKKPHQFVLGFAAETDNAVANGRAKLAAKNCDAIFVNDVSRADAGFETATNAGWWLDQAGVLELAPVTKTELAIKLLALLSNNLPTAPKQASKTVSPSVHSH